MNKLVLLLTAIAFSTVSASALEPLILEPLGNYTPVQNQVYSHVSQAVDSEVNAGVENAQESQTVHTAKYNTNPNMIPQNAAAEGLPVARKQYYKGIRIETKQGSRTNTQWNPGGKGTRSYF